MLPQHGAARSDGGQVGRMGRRHVHAALVKLELGKTYDFSHGHASLSKCGKYRINGALILGLLKRHGIIERC
jgi:hypothetical protein